MPFDSFSSVYNCVDAGKAAPISELLTVLEFVVKEKKAPIDFSIAQLKAILNIFKN